jgi:hypothetical protein
MRRVNNKIDFATEARGAMGHFPRGEDTGAHDGASKRRLHQSRAVGRLCELCRATRANAIDAFRGVELRRGGCRGKIPAGIDPRVRFRLCANDREQIDGGRSVHR